MIDMKLAEKIVDYLNDLLKLDCTAVSSLVVNRTKCNDDFANHPTCQVMGLDNRFSVGLLGIMNGLCGIDDKTGWGAVGAIFGDDDTAFQQVQRFVVLEEDQRRNSEDNEQ